MNNSTPWWKSQQFPFIQIPKALFQDPYYADLSPESKLLYGFLLDRVSLSWEQGDAWRTPQGEVFVIYTLREIQARLGCGDKKATRLLKALVQKALICLRRPQKDGPYHIIVQPLGQAKQRLPQAESTTATRQNNDCPPAIITTAHPSKQRRNHTEKNNTERNNTHLIRQRVEGEIKKAIEYDLLISEKDKLQWDGILEVMVDACTREKSLTLGSMTLGAQEVREKLMRTDCMRMDYVTDRLKQSRDIGSYRAFVLARLLEPEAAVDAFYDAWVRRS